MARLFRFISLPEGFQNKATVETLKNRLDWGEPTLTLIDVRNRHAFNTRHIVGAIAMPMHELVARAQASFELVRDIYVYGESDAQTTEAAEQLRNVGYQHIAELTGGLTAWAKAQYPVEGVSTFFG